MLVAEDDPLLRRMLDLALSGAGYAVWLAADGQAALDLYRRHGDAIDVALLDVKMPVLDGPAALRGLRAMNPDLPCCLMSGFLGEHDPADLLALGARHLIDKPFAIDAVLGLLGGLAPAAGGRSV